MSLVGQDLQRLTGARTGPRFVLTLTCPDRTGILAAIAGFLAETNCFIVESAHYSDPDSERFFGRTVFVIDDPTLDVRELARRFYGIASRFDVSWGIFDPAQRQRATILVSRFGHCLVDLLHRSRAGTLPMEVAAVISNHPDLRPICDFYYVPFHHLPVTPATRADQEQSIARVIENTNSELVLLARYMQPLSDELCGYLQGRAINIHHSFLPSFAGNRPYRQAYHRGVKMVGATAHYITPSIDDGPIIEQAVERIDHGFSEDDIVAVGRELENAVMARAVRYHLEHRVLLNGMKTVVFR